MRKAPTAKQQANWERFAREAKARARANKASGSSAPRAGAKSSDPSAARRRAARKAAKTRASWSYKAKKVVRDHPLLAAVGVGSAGVAAVPRARSAAARLLSGGLQRARLLLPK